MAIPATAPLMPTQVPTPVVQGFLHACRQEYVNGKNQAVGQFFQMQGGPYAGQLLPWEEYVRNAAYPAVAIDEIAAKYYAGDDTTLLNPGRLQKKGGRSLVNKVLCLSGIAAFCVLAEAGTSIAVHLSDKSVNRYWGDIPMFLLLVLVALAVPCCGFIGAKRGSAPLLCMFSGCSFCEGALLCLSLIVIATFISMVSHANRLLKDCGLSSKGHSAHPNCNQKDHDTFKKVCSSLISGWNSTSANFTLVSNPSTTNVTSYLKEQECLDTMQSFISILLPILVVFCILQVCSTCLSCCSGYFGCRLYQQVKDAEADGLGSGTYEED